MTMPVHILLVDDEPAEHAILRRLMTKVRAFAVTLHACETIEAAVEMVGSGPEISLVLMDDRLTPDQDFRETVPVLRKAGFDRPIGVISASLDDTCFQSFQDYGVDFRLDKAELDPTAIDVLLKEYLMRS